MNRYQHIIDQAEPSNNHRRLSDDWSPYEETERRAIQVLTRQQVAELPKPEWLIGDHIPQKSFGVVVSVPYLGKTFYAISQGQSVAHGPDWFGCAVAKGPVVYVLAEGSGSLDERLRAWEEANMVPTPGEESFTGSDFYSVVTKVNLMSVGDADALLWGIEQTVKADPVLIVIDTMARCMVGGDENSARDMGQFIDNVDRIREKTGAAVEALHHTGHDGLRERGSSSLRAAADYMIELKGNRDVFSAEITKQRDAQPADKKAFSKVPYAGSVVLVEQSADCLQNSARTLLETLKTVQPLDRTVGVSNTAWLDESGEKRTAFYDLKKQLVTNGLVENVGEKRPAWRTSEKGNGYLAMRVSPEESGNSPRTVGTVQSGVRPPL